MVLSMHTMVLSFDKWELLGRGLRRQHRANLRDDAMGARARHAREDPHCGVACVDVRVHRLDGQRVGSLRGVRQGRVAKRLPPP